ncbi:MAG: hypothetical protein R3D85_17695 [Paracoccaceae bacterium]
MERYANPGPGPGHNLHPADELGEIRARIRALQAREADLRQALLDDPGLVRGERFQADIRRQTRRVFLRDRLPPDILNRADLWEQRDSPVVSLRPRGPAAPAPARAAPTKAALTDDDDFAVIEPF